MKDRQHLLSAAFREIPRSIGDITLRPVSAGSYSLLVDLGNPMMTGGGDRRDIFAAVVQFAWVHSADLAAVCAVVREEDIPAAELRALGFRISLEDALRFTQEYAATSERISAAMVEPIEEEDEEEGGAGGKPRECAPTGSPASSSPAGARVIPPASVIPFGICPSSEPSSICTPQTTLPEPAASGPALLIVETQEPEIHPPASEF
jgi:hypothetical protein